MQMQEWMQTRGIMRCKLKGWMDKGGYYVEIKGSMQQGLL